MKKLLVAMMGTIIALGAISASLAIGNDDILSTMTVNPLKSTAAVMGHVTLTAYDENGVIKAYVQADNVITNIGDNCFAFVMLGASGSTTETCTGAAFPMYDNISIGIGDSSSATETTTALATYITSTTISPTGFDTSTVTGATTDQGSTTLITTVFRNVGATITEAAIQRGTNIAGLESVLAIQSFTGLPLGTTDNLTIQWTIVIDGS